MANMTREQSFETAVDLLKAFLMGAARSHVDREIIDEADILDATQGLFGSSDEIIAALRELNVKFHVSYQISKIDGDYVREDEQ